MKARFKAALIATLILSTAPAAWAQSGQAETSTSTTMSTGEVKKVDKSAGKLTIKHGPLTNLDMGAMTMVFRVKDPAMLDEVKAGDNISFVAELPDGQLTVARLERRP